MLGGRRRSGSAVGRAREFLSRECCLVRAGEIALHGLVWILQPPPFILYPDS